MEVNSIKRIHLIFKFMEMLFGLSTFSFTNGIKTQLLNTKFANYVQSFDMQFSTKFKTLFKLIAQTNAEKDR